MVSELIILVSSCLSFRGFGESDFQIVSNRISTFENATFTAQNLDFSSVLKDSSGEDHYLLRGFEGGGYYVYDTVENECVQFSYADLSTEITQASDIYFFGPNQFFNKVDETFVPLSPSQLMTAESDWDFFVRICGQDFGNNYHLVEGSQHLPCWHSSNYVKFTRPDDRATNALVSLLWYLDAYVSDSYYPLESELLYTKRISSYVDPSSTIGSKRMETDFWFDQFMKDPDVSSVIYHKFDSLVNQYGCINDQSVIFIKDFLEKHLSNQGFTFGDGYEDPGCVFVTSSELSDHFPVASGGAMYQSTTANQNLALDDGGEIIGVGNFVTSLEDAINHDSFLFVDFQSTLPGWDGNPNLLIGYGIDSLDATYLFSTDSSQFPLFVNPNYCKMNSVVGFRPDRVHHHSDNYVESVEGFENLSRVYCLGCGDQVAHQDHSYNHQVFLNFSSTQHGKRCDFCNHIEYEAHSDFEVRYLNAAYHQVYCGTCGMYLRNERHFPEDMCRLAHQA